MAEPSTHINYTFEDIQRYLQGKMTATEMHAMEKSALQDPFLADALEGYNEANPDTARRHINEINAGFIKPAKKSKVVAFNNKTRWLNVAAVIIIVSGISIFGIYFLKKSDKQEIAQAKNESPAKQSLRDSAAENKSRLPLDSNAALLIAQNKKLQKRYEPQSLKSIKKESTGVTANGSVQADDTNVTAMIASPVNQEHNEYASRSFAQAPLLKQKNDTQQQVLEGKMAGISIPTFRGKVIDENNNPISGAVIRLSDKKTTAVTNINGDFALQKSDSLLTATAGNMGYKTKNVELESGADNVIVLKTDSSALNAVVTVGFGMEKKLKTLYTVPAPAGGWQYFNQYVITQLNKDINSKTAEIADNLVEMEFLIDNSGNPYKIKIIKPLDDERDAKAVEILKSGPKWTSSSNNQKVRLSISF